MEYKELLKRARQNLPESALKSERFTVPNVRGHIQGNRTVLSNFFQIADALGREPDHLLKYILKELATPGEIQKNLVIVGSKVSAGRINQKVQDYTDRYVICKECKRPDTKLIRQERIQFIKCSACGAKYPIGA